MQLARGSVPAINVEAAADSLCRAKSSSMPTLARNTMPAGRDDCENAACHSTFPTASWMETFGRRESKLRYAVARNPVPIQGMAIGHYCRRDAIAGPIHR